MDATLLLRGAWVGVGWDVNVFSLRQTSGTSISSALFSEVPKTSHVDLHRLTNCL